MSYNPSSEIKEVSVLASGIFFSQVAWTAMKATDTALIFGTTVGEPKGEKAQIATAYSDLWTESSAVLLCAPCCVLGVFVANAVGAK